MMLLQMSIERNNGMIHQWWTQSLDIFDKPKLHAIMAITKVSNMNLDLNSMSDVNNVSGCKVGASV